MPGNMTYKTKKKKPATSTKMYGHGGMVKKDKSKMTSYKKGGLVKKR
jgi:hypothetical protein|tara:strand:- start:196 stop:336 length:141 start_codon:yes stop_codon:yes gene_type:complete